MSHKVTTVEIDLNVRIGLWVTFVGLDDCDGPVESGQVVNVVESESGIHGDGMVMDVDHDKQLVYLSVAWKALRLSVDDLVDRWHETGGVPDGEPVSLSEYLGMTDEEYARWLIAP